MNDTVLGFIGLGRMGTPMIAHLVAAGYRVFAYDPSPQALEAAVQGGAVAASGAAEIAKAADIVLLCLPTPEVVRAVTLGDDGLINGERVRIVIDLSTTGPKMTALVAAALAQQGKIFVDSPVSGGVAGAVKGTLALMVSAPAAVYEEIQPILAHLGRLFHVGEDAGLGQTLKLANNLLNVAAVAITSEAMVMGVKAGLDPQVMLDVINVSSGHNTATRDKFPKNILPRTFDFGFQTGLAYKDVRLCIDEAEALGVPMVVGGAVRQFAAMANAQLGPTSDFTELVKMVEGWSGVEVAAAG